MGSSLDYMYWFPGLVKDVSGTSGETHPAEMVGMER